MPIQAKWNNDEKTVLRYDFEGRWTWDEYFGVMAQITNMMKSVDHRVDAIANMKPGIMPTSGSAMSSARSALRKLPPNCGVVVVVTNSFISAMLALFKQFDRDLGKLLRGATSVEEAHRIIEQEREKVSVGRV